MLGTAAQRWGGTGMGGAVSTMGGVGITQRDIRKRSRVSELQRINRMVNAARPCGMSRRSWRRLLLAHLNVVRREMAANRNPDAHRMAVKEAIGDDWEAVGRDLRVGLRKYGKTLSRQ